MQENKTFKVPFPSDQNQSEYLHHNLCTPIREYGGFVFHMEDK